MKRNVRSGAMISLCALLLISTAGCGRTLKAEPETSAPAGTEIEDVLEKSQDHEHNIESEVVTEADCSHEGEVRNYCTVDGCDYEYTETVEKAAHTPGEVSYLYDGIGGHYEGQKCTVCGEIVEVHFVADESAQPDNKDTSGVDANVGSSDETNSGNGGNGQADNSGPNSGTSSSSENTDDGKNNTDSEGTPAHTHTYEKVVTQAPTCGKAGVMTYTCVNGDYSYTEEIPATGEHAYDESVVTTEPSCEEEGIRTFTCGVCEASYTEAIPATGHAWDDGVETQAPTCSEEGIKTFTCINDSSHTYTEPIATIEHAWDFGVKTKEETCTEDGVTTYTCTVCGETYTEPVAASGHSYSEGVITKDPECEVLGEKTYYCTKCGNSYTEEIPATGHDYEATTIRDASCTEDGLIMYECKNNPAHSYSEVVFQTGHDDGIWETVKEATYTESGLRELRCTKCHALLDTEILDVLPHEHNYTLSSETAATCTYNGIKVYTCSICGDSYEETVEASGHEYVWETTKASSCAENGLESYICAVCGDISETKEIPASGHTESDWIIDSEAGCTSEGSKHTECTTCGTTLKTEVIPSNGHSWGDLVITKEATEEEEGEGYYECANCGEKKYVTIDKTEPHTHDYEMTEETAPTCTDEGSKTYTCTICGNSYSESIAKIPHTPGDWEVVAEATEESEGERVQKCTVCQTIVNTEVIPKLEHTHQYEVSEEKAATCEEDGYIIYVCSGCGESYEEKKAAFGHDYELTDSKAATCTEGGYMVYTCKNDSSHVNRVTLDKLNHNYVESDRKAATCTEDGYIEYTCQNCGDSYQEPIAHTEHDYECVETVDATCELNGYKLYRCKNCGDEYKETISSENGHDYAWVITKEASLGVNGEKAYKCTVCGNVSKTEEIPMLMTDGTDHVYQICTGFDDNGDPVLVKVIGHFETEAAAKIADKVNELRESSGLSALNVITSGSLQNFANVRATEIVYDWSHTRPTDSSSVGTAWQLGENIAKNGYGTKDPDTIATALFDQWYLSSGHLANMVRDNYKNISVSVFAQKTSMGYLYYGVQNFTLSENWAKYSGDSWDTLIGNY